MRKDAGFSGKFHCVRVTRELQSVFRAIFCKELQRVCVPFFGETQAVESLRTTSAAQAIEWQRDCLEALVHPIISPGAVEPCCFRRTSKLTLFPNDILVLQSNRDSIH